MFISSHGYYAAWRADAWAAHTLAERPHGAPLTERLLQLIWEHQRLRRDDLTTTDHRPLRILHPGFWNHEAGPDFRGAVLQFADAPARSGDVEVDLFPQNWHAHHHDLNPAFRNVLLHVVWEADPGVPHPLPALPLRDCLDAPLEDLNLWLRTEPHPATKSLLGQCSTPLHRLPPEKLRELLHQAALIRLQAKGEQLQARARQTGWERALWDGLFAALGYKHNVWPMRRMADLLPALLGNSLPPPPALLLQARLLGVSGLLPNDIGTWPPAAAPYLRSLWNIWWRERAQFSDLALPPSLWRLGGQRPANNPQRRLALAAHWLATGSLPARLEQWFAREQEPAQRPVSLLRLLQPGLDPFWSRHWTFRSQPAPSPQPLVGPQRVTDLAMNVILPWFWVRARLGQNTALCRRAEECYFAWPKAEDNAVLRLARRRLFGESAGVPLTGAAMQQAVLQIVRDFCDTSNALCDACDFPSLVQEGVGSE